jgi:hypothetical protein
MSDRRKLRREWEKRGYNVTENGHGRVFDALGRLVATYSMSPGSHWSRKQDWDKLNKPVVPHGIKREPSR